MPYAWRRHTESVRIYKYFVGSEKLQSNIKYTTVALVVLINTIQNIDSKIETKYRIDMRNFIL